MKYLIWGLILCTGLLYGNFQTEVESQYINNLSVIPQSKTGGLDLFSVKKDAEIRKHDILDNFDMETKGITNSAIIGGVNAIAIQKSHFKPTKKRPRIGLVLSGGGARGGAHLGIIKAFEHHHIPIDAIVGTSMGSFIGGLYASGMSSGEIERMLTTMDWNKVITVEYDRREIPYRRKWLQSAFPGNAKVGINSDKEVVFGTGLFRRQTMLQFLEKKTYGLSALGSFDELRIPFRSVASRLRDGDTVVLREGSLAKAIYASIAIPGGFDPITINGEVLVDGGVADNLPLDVMRKEMNVDYIVVVDISTPYEKDAKFDNYISVMGQLINILMRKNVEDTILTMDGKENETLLTPDLEGYTPLDADKYPEIISIGRKTAETSYQKQLSHLSLYESDYYEYLAELNKPPKLKLPIINKIELDNHTYLNDKAILAKLHVQLGEKLDLVQLDKDIASIYNLMIFDDVGYEVITEEGINTLKLTTTPSWDVNGQVKFAIGFEDNFDGHSDYFIKVEYIKFGLNSYGGEWRSRVSFGQENLLLTELYQPITYDGQFYIRPAVYYRNKKVYVTPEILDPTIKSRLDDTFVLQAREYGGVLGLGVNITKSLRFEVMGDVKHVNPETKILTQDANNSFGYLKLQADANIADAIGMLAYDNLDNAFFPSQGNRISLEYRYSNQFSDAKPLSYSQYYIDYAGAFTWGRHGFLPHLKFGETLNVNDHGTGFGFQQTQDFSSFFTLGGLFNLTGLPTNAMTGNNISYLSLMYRYRLTQKDFFGTLSAPLYVGVTTESGSAWYGEDDFDADKIAQSYGAFLGADTIIGPFYIGAGRTVYRGDKYYSAYISLGKEF